MPDDKNLLTAKEFASLAGVKPSTITTWLRNGKLQGSKSNGKWMIPASQLKSLDLKSRTKQPIAGKPKPAVSGQTPAAVKADQTYSISEFAALTYLTELGVERWLKSGRLNGELDSSGNWKVDAANLELPHLRHLLRN